MLKFFRQYNKWFLAIGGTLLMIAFLIQPAMSIFVPQPGNQEIGRLNDETVTLNDRIMAAQQLDILSTLPLLRVMLPLEQRDEAMHYLLMQHEAQMLGVSASDAEVDQVLRDMQVGPTEMGQILQRLRTTEATVREAVRRWIAVQNYIPLINGRSYVPLQQRMQATMFGFQMAQYNPMQAMDILQIAQGGPRLSEPLLAHFIASQQATLGAEVVLVGYEQYLDQIAEPSDEQLSGLFQQYRDSLPGDGEPYGFGYRTPARVKMEWLQISADAVRAKVQVDEAEALEYFEQNKSRYADATEGAGETTYAQARDRVIGDLRQRRAEELGVRAARAAQAAMQEDPQVRRLARDGSYAAVPDDFAPMPLSDVARRVEERTGIAPAVTPAAEGWTAVSDLASLPGIGLAQVVGRSGIGFTDYLSSARELEPAADNPLTPLRLQRGLPSEPLRGFDGAYYVFRILEAQPSKAPDSLADVRDQVARDWRSLQAFERLQAERESLVEKARDGGLQSLAQETRAPMLSVGPVARREPSMMGMGLSSPQLPGIGEADALLDAMFDVAERVVEGEAAPGSLASIEERARVGAAPVEHRLSLAVFRVDSYQPITHEAYQNSARSPFVGAAVDRVLLEERLSPDDSPMSFRALARRVGYVGEGLDEEPAEGAAVANAG